VRIALLHGWGFDRHFWDAVIARLDGFGCRADDRGYYGAAEPAPAADLVVAHSLGTLRALAAPPAGCRGLLAINGFDCFARRDDFPHGVAPLSLGRMRARLLADPAAELAGFRARVGAPPPPPITGLASLLADLDELRDRDGRGRWSAPLMLLDGAEDRVVNAAHRAACFADRPEAPRRTVAGAGHVLPLTAPDLCADAIRAFAAILA